MSLEPSDILDHDLARTEVRRSGDYNGISAITFQELEDSWHSRVEEAQNRYREAAERYRKLLRAQPDGKAPTLNGDLALARKADSQALVELSRVLQIYADLIVNGKVPEEQSVVRAKGV